MELEENNKETPENKEVRKVNSIHAIVYLFITVQLVILLAIYSIRMHTIVNREVTKEEVIELISFEDSVYHYILELNIKHPDVVFKQARIESGNFTSRIFRSNNNMFGFKQAYKRPNTQVGVDRGYAKYDSWKECVIDYALYQTYSAKNLNEEDYIKFLGNNFAEDPDYLDKIK